MLLTTLRTGWEPQNGHGRTSRWTSMPTSAEFSGVFIVIIVCLYLFSIVCAVMYVPEMNFGNICKLLLPLGTFIVGRFRYLVRTAVAPRPTQVWFSCLSIDYDRVYTYPALRSMIQAYHWSCLNRYAYLARQ
jgi:hypothetical protein